MDVSDVRWAGDRTGKQLSWPCHTAAHPLCTIPLYKSPHTLWVYQHLFWGEDTYLICMCMMCTCVYICICMHTIRTHLVYVYVCIRYVFINMYACMYVWIESIFGVEIQAFDMTNRGWQHGGVCMCWETLVAFLCRFLLQVVLVPFLEALGGRAISRNVWTATGLASVGKRYTTLYLFVIKAQRGLRRHPIPNLGNAEEDDLKKKV